MSISKEMKVTIKGDVDPDILKWVNTLKYGAFPKIILEMLRWYESNNLLVRGGVVSPDLLRPKVPIDMQQIDMQQINEEAIKKILETVLSIDRKINSGQLQLGQGDKGLGDVDSAGSAQLALTKDQAQSTPLNEDEGKEPTLKMPSPFKVFTSPTK